MTNKPMLSVERELLERILDSIGFGEREELKSILDKEVDFLTPDCPDCACVQDGHCLCIPSKPADHPQCEECKGWGYHENHHEGGGTECGECGGSGNATVAVMPDVDELAQIIRKVDGSHTLGAGSLAEAILEEVARLNGVKP